jgi:hypothetical protein
LPVIVLPNWDGQFGLYPTCSCISRLILSGTSFGPEKAATGKIAAAKKTTGTTARILVFQKPNLAMQSPSLDYHRERPGLGHWPTVGFIGPYCGGDRF